MSKSLQLPTEEQSKLPKLSDKKIAYQTLSDEGLTNTQVANALDITPQRGSQIKKELEKYFIQDKKFLNKGRKVAKKILDDFLTDKGNIKDSTALRLVEMQQDRINPVAKNIAPTGNTFVVINLGEVQ